MAELKYKDLTGKIIGACFEVHKFLGNGFQEVISPRTKSVKYFHRCKSVIQMNYDIMKAHIGELKVETKEGEGSNLLFNYLVSESRLPASWLGFMGLKDYTD